jgi:threonine/homoserine/homoserine lactone efflux protein
MPYTSPIKDPLLFTLTVLAILGTPGPTNTLLATAGAQVGFRRALPLISAKAGGYMIAILVIGLVLRPILTSHPAIALTLRLLIGLYLLWLAICLWRRGTAVIAQHGRLITLREVFVTTLLNPKAIIFALSVIPFAAPRPWLYFAGFLGLLSAVALGWITFGTLMGRMASATAKRRLIPRLGAVVVAAFALVLVAGPLIHLR